MNIQTAFWLLITITGLELLALYALATTIKSTLKSDFFKKKIETVNQRESKKSSNIGQITNVILLLIISLLPTVGWAAEVSDTTVSESIIPITKSLLYTILAINIVLILVLYYLKNLLTSLLNYDKSEEELVELKDAGSAQFMHVLTDAVPLDQEHTIEMDHEYDGIRELDNNLPPWWVYMFYMTIIFAVIYTVRYHVTKTGDLQIAEYTKVIEEENAKVAAYLKSQAMDVDETNVVQMTEASSISSGKSTFDQFCIACHLEGGAGKIGPNLTDDYWIHGGDIKDIFKTIKNGASRGMKSWKDELNPIQMQEVASYIMSLKYISEAEGGFKPEGDKYVASDNSATEGTSGAEEETTTIEEEESNDITANNGDRTGKEVFDQLCVACHKPNGGGLVGPNLTDEFWKNGGSRDAIIKNVTDGIDGTAMQSFSSQINTAEIEAVVDYLMSLDTVNPPDGKEPEGDKYTP